MVFVTTGWIADAGPYAAGRRPGHMLSWNQIREAAAAGVEIGTHSHGHPQLDQVALSELRTELTTSKALLEDTLGFAVPGLAYPFGYSNSRVRQVASNIGFAHAYAVGNVIARPGSDPLAWLRRTIRHSTRPAPFDVIAYEPLIYVKDRFVTKGWAIVRRTRATAADAVRTKE